jgi:7-cyano-7-deazaguanine synthase in queuosine biosynthesis
LALRVVADGGTPVPLDPERQPDLCLRWEGPGRNATRNLSKLHSALPQPLSPLGEDLVDLATTIYLTDLGIPRGRNERWVREIEIVTPVHEPRFWQEQAADLSYLLYALTRDTVRFEFVPRDETAEAKTAATAPFRADSVSLLSGGIDSLAGAVMLLKTGRRPLLVGHQSGNPAIRSAQAGVTEMLGKLSPGSFRMADTGLHGGGNGHAASPFPPPQQREPSQRSRSFLFMSLALAAAQAQGASEAFIFENGILTMALPLSEARVGGMSTRSTHPRVIALMNRLAGRMQLRCELINPFIYQTKGEIIRDVLRPALSPFEIQRTISCWAAGRNSRQCGGCIACLVRRLSMLAAGLPDEAYQVDVLGEPRRYVGTDAYANMIDLLGLSANFATASDTELLQRCPELMDLPATGLSVREVIEMYRRFAEEVISVVSSHFPLVAPLMSPS